MISVAVVGEVFPTCFSFYKDELVSDIERIDR